MTIFDPLAERSPLLVALTDWMPPLITIVIGGFFASILFPVWQSRFNRSKAASTRRLEIAESVAKHFQKYITSWRRLISISELERDNHGLSDEQRQLKNSFVSARNANRDNLLEALCASRLYFSEQVYETIKEFINWDDLAAVKTLDSLPRVSEWREWEEKVVLALQREISK